MGTVIQFKPKPPKPEFQSLNQLLSDAFALVEQLPRLKTGVLCFSLEEFRALLKTRIQRKIIDRKMIDSNCLLCGLYISELLTRITDQAPTSWYVVDYIKDSLEQNGMEKLRQGADVCFLICSVFPERGSWRMMQPGDYAGLGAGLYYNYYCRSGREIGHHMSEHFNAMTALTKECMNQL